MSRILVVDDEPDLCEILKFNLENNGFEVDTANSAEEAMGYDLSVYDLFMLDVMMDKMSGFAFASYLRKNPETSQSSIIFVTAKDSENDALESRRKELYDARKDKKDDEIPQAEKDELTDVEQKITKLKSDKEAVLAAYAVGDKYVRQLIDITLLQNNMLTGEALNNFVKRSIELMK